VVWHSSQASFSMNGELRFALVDSEGKTSTPTESSWGRTMESSRRRCSLDGKVAFLHLPISAARHKAWSCGYRRQLADPRHHHHQGPILPGGDDRHPSDHAVIIDNRLELLGRRWFGLVSSPKILARPR